MIRIAPLSDAESAAVEQLLDQAFGADRHGRTAYRIRSGTQPIAALSFAAFDDTLLVGTLQSWPIKLVGIDGAARSLVLVGPVAVRPDRQRAGIGVALMRAMLAAADAGGYDALTLIGDPEYYDRLFGFNADQTSGWDVPGPIERHRLLARLHGERLNGLHGMLAPDRAMA